jgi:imidazolonepropionase-like amidohydrolase
LSGAISQWGAEVAAGHDARVDNVARLRAAGARILVGSDSPNLGLAAGVGTHRELDLLRDTGMTAAEVLSAATWANSRWLDPDARFGAIRAGWEADLVLVDGDPTVDPGAIHAIREVWIDGKRVIRHPRGTVGP